MNAAPVRIVSAPILKPSPRLAKINGKTNGRAIKFRFDRPNRFSYEFAGHAELPHVVKFSGGRTSGTLLASMLESGMLNPARGDVVVFNNTSAEHPATYDFIRQCKEMTESQYGVPFFLLEFQTYEDVYKRCWWRMPAYRLVNSRPRTDENPDGYQWCGEIFEELVSWKGYVPNQHSRVCTEQMKLFATREFLSDWFAAKPGIDRLGHCGSESKMVDDEIYDLHLRNRGETPKEIFLAKKKFLRSCPVARPAQKFADFCQIGHERVNNPNLADKCFGGRVDLTGTDCADYLAFVGFRADEQHRVARMRARNRDGDMQGDSPDLETTRPEGEYVYAPLASAGATRADVNSFWRMQNWGLQLPDDANLSNCVFCFLKGQRNIVNVITRQREIDESLPKELRSKPDTPSDINWWRKLEEKYGRDLRAEERALRAAAEKQERPIIGFFGLSAMSYGRLQQVGEKSGQGDAQAREDAAVLENLPCDCTD